VHPAGVRCSYVLVGLGGSGWGKKRACAMQKSMSAWGQERICRHSFNHLVGAGQQCRWYCEVERLCCFEIDYQFVLGGRLYRQISRFLAFKNAIGVFPGPPELVYAIWTVGNQATVDCIETKTVYGR